MSNTEELETRKKIRDLIARHPGLTVFTIADMLDMSTPLVDRYLTIMKEKGEVCGRINEQGTQYYLGVQRNTVWKDRRSQKTRKKVYEIVEMNPGMHLSKIAEMLDMTPSLAEYHLLHLEKADHIIGVRDEAGYYKRYYLKTEDLGIKEKGILSTLRQKPLLKIVLLLIKHGNLKHKEIADILNIAPSTLSYHIGKLADLNVIVVVSYGKEKGYSLKNEKEIIRMVRRYQLHTLVDGLTDTWKDLNLF